MLHLKSYFKQNFLLILFALFSINISLSSCENKDSDEQSMQLTPKALYQTSWRGTGHCEAWLIPNRGIGIQFVDTQKGIVNWENYDQIDITYTIEGKYITFNNNAFCLAGAPWVIISYTSKHMTLKQNLTSPDKANIATIELDKVN